MLVLASQSPRRREILQTAGISFRVEAAEVEESVLPGEAPAAYVRRLARAKAEAIAEADGPVLGADTIVVVDERILGKPSDCEDARRMLKLLSGREHIVMTGVCLRHGAKAVVDAAETRVRFIALSDQEIQEYVDSGEPLDKAGAYAIQGLASKFIDRVQGCYFNVVGLPIAMVYGHMKAFGLL
jgi:septum formation protein